MHAPIKDHVNKRAMQELNSFWESLENFIDSQCRGINWRGTDHRGRVVPKTYV